MVLKKSFEGVLGDVRIYFRVLPFTAYLRIKFFKLFQIYPSPPLPCARLPGMLPLLNVLLKHSFFLNIFYDFHSLKQLLHNNP